MREHISSLVSTIIPVRNRATMLREAVASVLAQTYRPIEVIIVDDGSNDETPSVCDELAEKFPETVIVIHQSNGGPGAAREAGRQRARGEFIQHLDSDDLLLPRKFELQVAALRANPDRAIAYCFGQQIVLGQAQESTLRTWSREGNQLDTIYPEILRGRPWDTSGPLYRRSLTDMVGPWSSAHYEEDLEYDIRAACLGARAIQVPECLAITRCHAAQMSAILDDRDPYRHQTQSRLVICGHIRRSGIPMDNPAVQHFGRALFLIARQAGAMGFTDEAAKCFTAARSLLRMRAGGDPQSFAYSLAARVLGHRIAGSASQLFDTIRNRARGLIRAIGRTGPGTARALEDR
jgi:GT2 family glycosyltransferase